MLYEKDLSILKSLYKSASFVIQAICFKQTGEYFSNKTELLEAVSEGDKLILDAFLNIKSGKEINFNNMSELMFNWSKRLIK